MSVYGLTNNGPNIKRLDNIMDDMHNGLSKSWGVNTRQDPESFLNHLLTNIADKIAELWEFGEDVYYSQYPYSAEGINLDNAAQYGGSTRETAAKSYYVIHCTGKDGSLQAAGTMIESDTNPSIQLTLADDKLITRSSFNKAVIKVASLGAGSAYTVALNGAVYAFSPENADSLEVLNGLSKAITDKYFTTTVDEENKWITIEAVDITSTNVLVLSENLTTETVTSLLTFGTVDTGDILIPDGAITRIVKADASLISVVNHCDYIAGRDEETDVEFRRSYADKIFNRSSNMLESIKSAILNNVQGVTSVAPYENPSHMWDDFGRPPHSIEIVVDGGDSKEIAQQILNNKAGGINTFGDTVVILPGKYDEDITIRFNRPAVVYTWFHLGITLRKGDALPPNYVELLRGVILNKMAAIDAGKDVIPQEEFMSELYQACSGISYIDIRIFTTLDASEKPGSYDDRTAVITARQRAFTDEEMIEVEIDG